MIFNNIFYFKINIYYHTHIYELLINSIKIKNARKINFALKLDYIIQTGFEENMFY